MKQYPIKLPVKRLLAVLVSNSRARPELAVETLLLPAQGHGLKAGSSFQVARLWGAKISKLMMSRVDC